MRYPRLVSALTLLLGGSMAAAGQAADFDSNTFGGFEARSIGPAVMSGRVAAIDAAGPAPLTVYVGAATGGLWKSTDGGVDFDPVFDDHNQSIGAVRIDPSDRDTVWVGTGESWTRNSVSVGDGVYKTTDGGKSWKRMGLEESERIARIRIHPDEGDTVWVCATGQLWSANEERGVYKTTDGGETWERVLYVDENTGCADIDIDPQDPEVLYAAMWQFRRYPDFFESGGPGSGLYKTTDGGETWNELTEGLPSGDKGRIAIAVAPSRPSVVYAVVEAKETALYRSQDLGATWIEVNDSFSVSARPFYFGHIVVDPADYNRVYKPGFTLAISEDGGKSMTNPFAGGFGNFGVHPDHHAVWINPDNPNEVFLGTDGGVYHSRNRAGSWSFVRTLPISQFYRVSYDLERPYNVYGGLQDNGSWKGPSQSVGGIENRDWLVIGGGDGFYAFADLADPDFVYVEYQGGNIQRVNLVTNESRDIKPRPKEGEPDYRWNWNTPIHISPNDPNRIYIGAQFVFRSEDHGESWDRISPDLTTNDPAKQRQKDSGGLSPDNTTAENHTTIYIIRESPHDPKVLWVGTDDGNLQLSRDGGDSWTNLIGNVPDLPPHTWVSYVDVSPHDPGTAFVTFDGHRTGDMTPYLYKTTDYGATWTSLVTEDIEAFCRSVRQDSERPDLLFLGTEGGLYISIDGGGAWARFSGNLPKVPVHDLAVHPYTHDLIVGTHGRGIYILDNISPLRQLTPEVLEADVTLLETTPFTFGMAPQLFSLSTPDEFIGPNPPEAVRIDYFLKKRHLFGDLKIEVRDSDGELITTIPGGKRRGLNRVTWPMRLKPPEVPPASSLAMAFQGPRVPEGTYEIRLIKNKDTFTDTVTLQADPDSRHSAEDRALQQSTALALYEDLADLTYLVEAALEARDAARKQAGELKERDRLAKALDELADELETFRTSLVTTSEGLFGGDEKLREKLAELYSGVIAYNGRPTDTQLDRKAVFERQLAAAAEALEEIRNGSLAEVNRTLARRDLPEIPLKTREAWEAANES